MGGLSSVQYWYWAAVHGQHSASNGAVLSDLMLRELNNELPADIEVTGERTCNLQCTHCIFQPEISSKQVWQEGCAEDVVLNIVRQLPDKRDDWGDPGVIFGGRILQSWHLDLLSRICKERPDVRISIIENGTYVRLLDKIEARGIQVARLDLSLDGIETSHNRQRDPSGRFRGESTPWAVTMEGFRQARRIARTVSANMTLTSLNFADVGGVAETVLGSDLADELHISIVTVKRPELEPTQVNSKQFQIAWEGLKSAYRRFSAQRPRVFFRCFTLEDLLLLEAAVGSHKLWRAFNRRWPLPRSVWTARGNVLFTVDGVEVSFFPLSIWPHEAFLIDVDGATRVAYAQQFTLEELQSDTDRKYTVVGLTANSSYSEMYERVVRHWWKGWGQKYFEAEKKFFSGLKQRAKSKAIWRLKFP